MPKKINQLPDSLPWSVRRLLTLWTRTNPTHPLEPTSEGTLLYPASRVGMLITRPAFQHSQENQTLDQARLQTLKDQGYTVLQFTPEDILTRPYQCVERLEAALFAQLTQLNLQ